MSKQADKPTTNQLQRATQLTQPPAGLDVLLYDDADLEAYVRQYEPDFLPDFLSLISNVERADAWRWVHVLHACRLIEARICGPCSCPAGRSMLVSEWAF